MFYSWNISGTTTRRSQLFIMHLGSLLYLPNLNALQPRANKTNRNLKSARTSNSKTLTKDNLESYQNNLKQSPRKQSRMIYPTSHNSRQLHLDKNSSRRLSDATMGLLPCIRHDIMKFHPVPPPDKSASGSLTPMTNIPTF